MTLTTVKDYCIDRGVSRQFVYEYIRKGKFEKIELPIFVEFEGHKVAVGKQKFLKVPPQYAAEKKPYWSGNVSDDAYATAMAADASDDVVIQKSIAQYLSITDEVIAAQFKQTLFNQQYPIGHAKRPELEAAFAKCVQLMLAEMADLEQNVHALETL
jgi:hypothetical protein